MARADFVHLPMHPGRSLVVNLHAIHPEIARAGFRIARVHVRQSDETPAILRPAFQDRQIAERKVRSSVGLEFIEAMHHFLARAVLRHASAAHAAD